MMPPMTSEDEQPTSSCRRRREMTISSCVFQGSALPVSAKIEVIFGTTDDHQDRHDDRRR